MAPWVGTRRNLLRAAAGTGVLGLVGCSAPGTTPSLDSGPPSYRRWIPANSESITHPTYVIDLDRFRAIRDHIRTNSYEAWTGIATIGDYVGVDFEEIETALVWMGGDLLLTGAIDHSNVRATLERSGYEPYGETNTAEVYRMRSPMGEPASVAVGDRGVLKGTPDGGFVDRATTLFETRNGNEPRLHERSEPYRRFTDAIGSPKMAGPYSPPGTGRSVSLPGDVEDVVASGIATYYSESHIWLRNWFWTSDPDTVPASAVRRAVETALEEAFEEAEYTVVRTDGRVVDVLRSERVEDPGGGSDPLQVTVRATRADGAVTIIHLAGDPIPVEELRLYGGLDYERDDLGTGTLEPGESLTVSVPAALEADIDVVFTRGTKSSLLATAARSPSSEET